MTCRCRAAVARSEDKPEGRRRVETLTTHDPLARDPRMRDIDVTCGRGPPRLAAGSRSDNLGSIFQNVERDLDVALGTEVIDFVGINCFEHTPQSGTVGQIAIVQGQSCTAKMGVVVKMIDAISVEEARAPH